MTSATANKPTLCLLASPSPSTRPPSRPPAHVTGPPDPGHHQRQGRPGQDVEGRRTEQVIATQHDGHGRGGDRGQQLRPAAAAELPCRQPGQHDRRPGRQGRPHPEPEQRHAEQLQRNPRQQRRQHRLVDVAGLQMTGAFHEVQLVAVKPVPRRQRQQDGEDNRADRDHAPVEGSNAAGRTSGVPARFGRGSYLSRFMVVMLVRQQRYPHRPQCPFARPSRSGHPPAFPAAPLPLR